MLNAPLQSAAKNVCCSLYAPVLLPLLPTAIMSEANKPTTPTIDASGLKTSYANVCRIAQTPNEVIIDFGVNPNFFGNILDEPLRLDNRIILSHDAAKRLCLHLTATIQNFEARYGTIELDVTKRLKNQPAVTSS
jgi:hypothetical protein